MSKLPKNLSTVLICFETGALVKGASFLFFGPGWELDRDLICMVGALLLEWANRSLALPPSPSYCCDRLPRPGFWGWDWITPLFSF